MVDPIYHFENIANTRFFTNTEARKNEYCDFYDEYLMVLLVRNTFDSSGISYADFNVLDKSKNYWELCYLARKFDLEAAMRKEILAALDENKIKVYVKIKINQINIIIRKIEALELESDLQVYKDNIIERMRQLNATLISTYLVETSSQIPAIAPKIRWKGDLKVLTTLFFELKYGQEKGFGANRFITPSMLEAEKKDLQALLLNNFLDSEGNPLKPNTINDYLNRAKPEHRSPEKERLEFPVK